MAINDIKSNPLRIGLLTPYGGTNLGDGAIQTAAINGIRQKFRGAELWGITLNPSDTTRRHGIPALPITGLRVPFYSESLFRPIDGLFFEFSTESKPKKTENISELNLTEKTDQKRLWKDLKRYPIIGSILKFIVSAIRSILNIAHEIVYLKRSYSFTKTLDMIIVSGGGQLDELWGGPWGHPYALFRWAVLAKLAGKRFIVISVGVGELKTISGRFLIKVALALSSYRSYRDLDSKGLLKVWPFTSSDLCVPDLAFGLPLSKHDSRQLPKNTPLVIGVGPIAYGHETLWPNPAHEIYTSYLEKLAQFLSIASNDYQIKLLTSSGSDRTVVKDLQAILLPNLPADRLRKINSPTVENVERLIEELSTVDLVVASRLHSVILSHILKKPVIAISFDRKVDTHMRDMVQEEYLLDINNFTTTEVLEKLKILESHMDSIQTKLTEKLLKFKQAVEEQYNNLSKFDR